MDQNDTRDIKPIFLIALEIEIISGQLDAENLSVEFTTSNNQSQIVEICPPIVPPIQKMSIRNDSMENY
ncbi:MAG: hypothetical protein IPN15_04225 [Saprospiraceae bacterium]|nr:hypothetical protein [Candidatus Vicinibacter affinis]